MWGRNKSESKGAEMSTEDTGTHGFDELRKFIKQEEDFCKDIASVLHERSELEATYAKGLAKLASKIQKATRETLGTTSQAWQEVATSMENESDLHRSLAFGLQEDVVKPLKILADSQHKLRKNIEGTVDKSQKQMSDRRNEEQKAKKMSYASVRENERMQDQVLDAKAGRGKVLTDKDIFKLETKRRKAEEAVVKSDHEYYTSCIKAERARQEWESVVYRANNVFQQMEADRLSHMQDMIQKYADHLQEMGPAMTQCCERLNEGISSIDVQADIQLAIQLKGTGPNIPEQQLPDFYGEDMNNSMKRERRKESLEKFLQMLKHDLELERRGKQGVENLARVFQETPNFGDLEAQQDINEKLQQLRAMLTYLEATRYKVQCALADLDGQVRPTHPLSSHLEQHKDKAGSNQTVLKVPPWVRMERRNSEGSSGSDSPDFDRGMADGISLVQDNLQEVMYENRSEILASSNSCGDGVPTPEEPIGQCRALYDYQANLADELTIRPGDIITVYSKPDSNWWQGELHGIVGMFPATYVEDAQ